MMDSPEQIRDEIVVVAQTVPSAAIGNPPPLMQLRTQDVEAFGTGSVNDMIRRLKPSAAVLAGTPANASPLILLNGRRISDDAEVGEIPSEAVERIDILAASVSIRYGLAPGQPVMNFVLKKRFRAETGSASVGKKTSKGGASQELGLNTFRLLGERRLNILAKLDRSAASYSPVSADDPFADQVVLGPQIEQGVFKATMATKIGGFAYATFGATLDFTRIKEPLTGQTKVDANRRSNQRRIRVDATLAKSIGRWHLSMMAAADQMTARSHQLGLDEGDTRYDARGSTLNFSFLAAGPIFTMSGETATASIALAAERTYRESRSFPFFAHRMVQDNRSWSARLGLALPLHQGASGKGGTLSQSLSLNADGDALTARWGLASETSWTPFAGLQSTFAISLQQDRPSAAERSAPPKAESATTIFDYRRNEIAQITIFSGGNPLLKNGQTIDISARLFWQPFDNAPVTITAQLGERRQSNGVLSISTPVPLLEFAYPERFQRDIDGRLQTYDARPVNLLRSKSRDLDLSLSASGSINGSNPLSSAFYASSINVRRRLYNHVVLAPGISLPRSSSDISPVSDGRTGVEWNGSLAKKGTGADLGVRWTEGSKSQDLSSGMIYRRSSAITFNAQVYIELDTVFPRWHFAKSTKLTVSVTSLSIKSPRLTYATERYSNAAQSVISPSTGNILVRFEKRI